MASLLNFCVLSGMLTYFTFPELKVDKGGDRVLKSVLDVRVEAVMASAMVELHCGG